MSSTNFSEIRDNLQTLYLEDARPWLVGFSGGKDSSAVTTNLVKSKATYKTLLN